MLVDGSIDAFNHQDGIAYLDAVHIAADFDSDTHYSECDRARAGSRPRASRHKDEQTAKNHSGRAFGSPFSSFHSLNMFKIGVNRETTPRSVPDRPPRAQSLRSGARSAPCAERPRSCQKVPHSSSRLFGGGDPEDFRSTPGLQDPENSCVKNRDDLSQTRESCHIADPPRSSARTLVDAASDALQLAILGGRANPRTLPNRCAFDDLVVLPTA
jgi:hypothetical protein